MIRSTRPVGRSASRRGAAGDAGFTLPELLVVMVLLAVVMTLVVSFLTSFSRTFTKEQAATDSINLASSGMVGLTRVIRAGTEIRTAGGSNLPVFEEVSSEKMILHAVVDTDSAIPQPMQVTFWIRTAPDGTRELMEKRCLANAGTGPYWTFMTASACSEKLVTRHVVTPAESEHPLFRYQDLDGNHVVLPATGSLLAPAQLKTIARVDLYFEVQSSVTSRAKPVVLEGTVGIPNLGIDRVGASL